MDLKNKQTHGLHQGMLYFGNITHDTSWRLVFQLVYESHSCRSVEDHLESPGVFREHHTHGRRLGIAHILKHLCDTCL